MSEKTPKGRRSISKAKLYVVIKEAVSEYGLSNTTLISELLDELKEDIVIDATK